MDKRSFLGECLGTFILTLFGCSSVACAVLFGEYGSIFQIGLVWGLAVTLAVYMTRYLSCAHLNPAVSVAMVLAGRMKAKKLPCYPVSHLLYSPRHEHLSRRHRPAQPRHSRPRLHRTCRLGRHCGLGRPRLVRPTQLLRLGTRVRPFQVIRLAPPLTSRAPRRACAGSRRARTISRLSQSR